MITRIEALNYRCLRHVAQDLGPFHILVGPNASGKSTFLDVPGLMRDLVRDGRQDIGDAISSRSPNYEDLIWLRQAKRFALAIEAQVPERLAREACDLLGSEGKPAAPMPLCRYEVVVGSTEPTGEMGILSEYLSIGAGRAPEERVGAAMPLPAPGVLRDLAPPAVEDWLTLLEKDVTGKTWFDSEVGELHRGRRRTYPFSLGHRLCGLANLPEDETQFPVAAWFKRSLSNGVKSIALNPAAMRQPSPPNARRTFMPDGTSTPWLLDNLAPGDYEQWLAHLRTELPNLAGIRSVERPEDRHRYLKLKYEGGLEVPSWVVSDGTLEMLALTLLPYLPDKEATYLVEEPENCVHPTAIEAIFESLSSIYGGQVLMATHSPVILGLADLEHVLCFTKDEQDATRIVRGKEHRILRNWQGEFSLGTLFASGVME